MEETRSEMTKVWLLLGGCLGLFLCLACSLGLTSYLVYQQLRNITPDAWATITAVTDPSPLAATTIPTLDLPPAMPTPAQHVTPLRPTPADTSAATPTITIPATPPPTPAETVDWFPPAEIGQNSIPAAAFASLETLYEAIYPPLDYYETALRLGKWELDGRTIAGPTYTLGDTHTFSTDLGQVTARLVAVTPHTYFWVEQGLNLSDTAVTAAANQLENDYYPQLTALFGQEWQPGIDNDPHFSVLHLRLDPDATELGYFYSLDEYPRSLYSDSNEQEMIYLNMSALEVGAELYDGTLVHEVQHLIQWHVDPNEDSWMNEGLSQLAELYLGLHTADYEPYLEQPDIRLNTWEDGDEVIDAHYAAAYLFAVYLWEQLGDTAIQELSRHPANGLAAVRSVLRGYDKRTLEQFVADWAVANYLDDPLANPLYTYRYLDLERPSVEKRIRNLPETRVDTLNQFGVHYYQLLTGGITRIRFAGDTLTPLTDTPPPQGDNTIWFAPAMDETAASLTIPLDLTGLSQSTLQFDTWYQLEEDWDFAYLSISVDDGAAWDLLTPQHLTAGDYGPAWNGRSTDADDAQGGWVSESISLNRYTGQPVLLRFDVLSDSSISEQGFALSHITLAQRDLAEDGRTPDNWTAVGFVQTTWQLPQQWQLRLIQHTPQPEVITLPLNSLNQGQWEVNLGDNEATLVIIPLTPFTNQPANYWLEVGR